MWFAKTTNVHYTRLCVTQVSNRKAAFKKRFAPKPKPLAGPQFPKDKKGLRSTTPANRDCLAAALSSMDVAAGQKCLAEKMYRFGYAAHFLKLVKLGKFL